ncbi:MAG: biotin--[acetyl-CoA-carboxylase] ligase [Candidatus Cloacimonetes bacterium 4572_65]|nr:MAG: biotin--[acetyl-CoA-carboxylase] ligase [Candidatus Cloacimonetes bacterium 4572_65]
MFLTEHPLFDEIIYKNKLNSTSTHAYSLIKDKLVRGNFIVVAEEQSSGKGRQKNIWYSPKGGLWFSMGLYNIVQNSSITLYIAVILHQTLLDIYPSMAGDLQIKWPNDIMLGGKKVCGILTSYYSWAKYLICGIGLDTNVENMPIELSEIATSLRGYLGIEINNSIILKTFLDKLYASLPLFIENGFIPYKSYYNKNSYLKGKVITLDTEFQLFNGKVLKVNGKGALIMELGESLIQPFYSGSVVKID